MLLLKNDTWPAMISCGPIDQVVILRPALAPITRSLPQVPELAPRQRGPGAPVVERRARGLPRDGEHAHAPARESAGELQGQPGGVAPELMPQAVRRLVIGQAGPDEAAHAFPALLQRAAAMHRLDPVASDHATALGQSDVPGADPEVELAVLGGHARPRT